MLAVIDESGDPGFKSGSSSHFVLGMVIFDSFSDAEAAANMINNIREEIGYRREFHFNKCDDRKRDHFFEAIKPAKFRVRLLVIEKRLLHSENLKHNKEKFVNYCLKMLMRDDGCGLVGATVKIDGSGSKIFKKASAQYLSRELSKSVVSKVKFQDSQKDVLIQLADMVVSAYARPYQRGERKDAYRWRNLIEKKIENVWNFR